MSTVHVIYLLLSSYRYLQWEVSITGKFVLHRTTQCPSGFKQSNKCFKNFEKCSLLTILHASKAKNDLIWNLYLHDVNLISFEENNNLFVMIVGWINIRTFLFRSTHWLKRINFPSWVWFLEIGLFFVHFGPRTVPLEVILQKAWFIILDSRYIISLPGFCILKKINSVGPLEKLHRAVLVQLALIVFHSVKLMKGIPAMNHIIASNHWWENCHVLDGLHWSFITLRREH